MSGLAVDVIGTVCGGVGEQPLSVSISNLLYAADFWAVTCSALYCDHETNDEGFRVNCVEWDDVVD